MTLILSSFAHAEEVCGIVKIFSAMNPSEQYAYKVEFVDGSSISNVELRLGQEAFITASLIEKARLCFSIGGSVYTFSSVSK
jgi:hypothetical protein